MERKLDNNAILKSEYSKFIHEYEKLDHMQRIEDNKISKETAYSLPHHCIIKPDSTTTKLRVVFDASCKSTNGLSLNDVLMVGPVIQKDLFSIMLKFRLYKYTIGSDIEKMYRQILVHNADQKYQRLLWRC